MKIFRAKVKFSYGVRQGERNVFILADDRYEANSKIQGYIIDDRVLSESDITIQMEEVDAL